MSFVDQMVIYNIELMFSLHSFLYKLYFGPDTSFIRKDSSLSQIVFT